MQREPSRQIEHDAAQWAARVDRGLSAAEDAELESWLGADPRRHGAFMRMRAIALHSERAKALGPTFDGDAFLSADNDHGDDVAAEVLESVDDQLSPEKASAHTPGRGAFTMTARRKFLWVGGALAASLGLLFAGPAILSRGESFETRLGESRIVTLADGSVMTLNTSSRVKVRYRDEERLIELQHGEALFDVAHVAGRPFVVFADGARVRAVGTSFTVKKLAERPLSVMVGEGTVELTRPSLPRPVRISANTVVSVGERSSAPRPVAISRDEVQRETAWTTGRIALEGESLSEAAAEFARYSDVRIIIDDPTVAREEITGLFASNDPVSFARAAASSLGLRADIGDREVRLTR